MKEKIVSDFKYYFLDIFIISVIGYIFYIMMGRMLEPMDYGIMMTILGLYTILSPLTSFGFNEALARFLPMHSGDRVKAHVYYALTRVVLFSAVVGLLIFFFSSTIAESFYNNSFMGNPLKIFALLLVIGSISIVFKGTLQGTKRFFSILVMDIFSQALRIIVPIVLIYYGYTVISGLIGWVATFFAFDLIAIVYLWKRFSKYSPMVVDREFFKYGLSSAVFASALWLLVQNSLLILGFVSMEEAGLFSVALVFGQINLMLPLIIIGVTLPYLSEFFSRRDNDRAKRLSELTLKNTFIILFPLSVFIVFFAKQIIYHIYNPTYLSAALFFPPIIFAFMFLGLNIIMMNILYSYGKHLTRIKYTVLSCILSVLYSLILVAIYGSIGVAYGFMLAQVVTLFLLAYACKRKTHIGFPRKILNAAPAMAVFIVLIYLIDLYYINFEYGIALIAVATLIYAILLFAFKTFDNDDFYLLKKMLGR